MTRKAQLNAGLLHLEAQYQSLARTIDDLSAESAQILVKQAQAREEIKAIDAAEAAQTAAQLAEQEVKEIDISRCSFNLPPFERNPVLDAATRGNIAYEVLEICLGGAGPYDATSIRNQIKRAVSVPAILYLHHSLKLLRSTPAKSLHSVRTTNGYYLFKSDHAAARLWQQQHMAAVLAEKEAKTAGISAEKAGEAVKAAAVPARDRTRLSKADAAEYPQRLKYALGIIDDLWVKEKRHATRSDFRHLPRPVGRGTAVLEQMVDQKGIDSEIVSGVDAQGNAFLVKVYKRRS